MEKRLVMTTRKGASPIFNKKPPSSKEKGG
jgi:hypothetical protein